MHFPSLLVIAIHSCVTKCWCTITCMLLPCSLSRVLCILKDVLYACFYTDSLHYVCCGSYTFFAFDFNHFSLLCSHSLLFMSNPVHLHILGLLWCIAKCGVACVVAQFTTTPRIPKTQYPLLHRDLSPNGQRVCNIHSCNFLPQALV